MRCLTRKCYCTKNITWYLMSSATEHMSQDAPAASLYPVSSFTDSTDNTIVHTYTFIYSFIYLSVFLWLFLFFIYLLLRFCCCLFIFVFVYWSVCLLVHFFICIYLNHSVHFAIYTVSKPPISIKSHYLYSFLFKYLIFFLCLTVKELFHFTLFGDEMEMNGVLGHDSVL